MVLARSKQRVNEAHRRIEAILAELGLQLNPAKTKIVELTEGKAGFDFLGFHLHKVESWKHQGYWYLQRWPSRNATKVIRARIRDATNRRYVGLSVDEIVTTLNPKLRAWANYFRYGNSSKCFAALDSYVHERLAIFASNKHGRRGRHWTTHYDGEWFRSLNLFQLSGTVRYGTVHAYR